MPAYPGLRKQSDIDDWLSDKTIVGPDFYPWAVRCIQFAHRKGARSQETYNGFRTILERFLLFLMKEQLTPDAVRTGHVTDFVEFCQNPESDWVMTRRAHRFDGDGHVEENWRPFFGYEGKRPSDPKKTKGFSQAALRRQFSFIKQWYEDLVDEGLVSRNPVVAATKESGYLTRGTEEVVPNSFTKDEWVKIFQALVDAANEDPAWERSLFVLLLMKSCYLRVSDLCARPHFDPMMSHIYQYKSYWFLKVMSKGLKTRSVSIPDALLEYVERYRQTRGLDGLPTPNERHPLISKDKGMGGVGKRQMDRIIKSAFKQISERLKHEDTHLSKKVEEATTHILRHTGASIDAFWRPLPELAEELGHADPGTTGRIYVHSLREERAKLGSKRSLA